MMCMDGMKARSVSCRDSDLSLLPNLACDGLERPASVENCATEFPNECLLTPIFVHGDYQPVCTTETFAGIVVYLFVHTRRVSEHIFCTCSAQRAVLEDSRYGMCSVCCPSLEKY